MLKQYKPHPVKNCTRCGAPDHSQPGDMQNSRPPNWFYASKNKETPGRQVKFPSIDVSKLKQSLDRTEKASRDKVRDWLHVGGRGRRSRTFPSVGAQTSLVPFGTVHGYSDGDFHRDYTPAYTPAAYTPAAYTPAAYTPAAYTDPLPDNLHSLSRRLAYRRRRDFGRREDFTTYLSPGKSLVLRPGVGSILRPHDNPGVATEGQRPAGAEGQRQAGSEGQRQRLNESVFMRHGPSQHDPAPPLGVGTSVRDLEEQRARTYELHGHLKDMLRKEGQ